jgi:predicted phage-related endonuclease
MIERRPIISRTEWLEWRKPFVTASQVPALFGAHPYLTALKLYMEKSGVEFPEQDDPVMRRGRLLEPAVGLAVAEERPEWTIRPAKEFFCDNDRRIAATPDFFIEGEERSTKRFSAVLERRHSGAVLDHASSTYRDDAH